MAESQRSRGRRRGEEAIREVGRELRQARLGAGLTQATLAAAAGLSPAEVSRIERGCAPWLTFQSASEIAAVVGLDLWVRCYPSGDPVRDAAHVALLERVRRLVRLPLVVRAEMPIAMARDPRAWDLVIELNGRRVGVEAETRLADVQALFRRLALKRRDGQMEHVVLAIADRPANRRILRSVREMIRADYPLDGSSITTELLNGRMPKVGGVLLL